MYSETNQTTPMASIIPIYGGKWVTILNIGTDIIIPKPRYSIGALLSNFVPA